jgi:predicted O-methyltransferase YrrM
MSSVSPVRAWVRAFRRNLRVNLQALTLGQRAVYRAAVRPFLAARERFFFEGAPGVAGQLYRAERRALHDALLQRAPSIAFEIGTFNGGGSTFCLAMAFARLGRGRLVTLELDPDLHRQAVDLYETQLPELRPYVEFVLGGDPELFVPRLEQAGAAEFVFLDGAEDAEQSLDQFRFFEEWLRQGSVIAVHDWHTEKMRLLRREVTASGGWETLTEVNPPDGQGLMIKKLGSRHPSI